MTRENVRENFKDLISNKCRKSRLKYISTGGSSGKPLMVAKDKTIVREAQKWRIQNWWNLEPTENIATIYRPIPRSAIEKFTLSLINWPQKVISLLQTPSVK